MTSGMKLRAPGPAEVNAPRGATVRRPSGATNVEGRGDGSVEAVAFLEGVEPHTKAAEAKAAVTEALRNVIAPDPFVSSGVVGMENTRGMEVVELKRRYRHARTAFPAMEQS